MKTSEAKTRRDKARIDKARIDKAKMALTGKKHVPKQAQLQFVRLNTLH